MILFDLDPNPANATYKIQLVAGVTGTDTVTEPGMAPRDEPWFSGCGTPLSGENPLPSTWVIPAGDQTAGNCQMSWTEIQPDPQPDPDNPCPG
jgi:hypothetical protein